eukprot:snap_masked-scaffold_21-processed-gene-2.37-mRNA-1 protein AED:1.00 eAED:1.00 QI:0/-1/0/0/-1/1/1/0/129
MITMELIPYMQVNINKVTKCELFSNSNTRFDKCWDLARTNEYYTEKHKFFLLSNKVSGRTTPTYYRFAFLRKGCNIRTEVTNRKGDNKSKFTIVTFCEIYFNIMNLYYKIFKLSYVIKTIVSGDLLVNI